MGRDPVAAVRADGNLTPFFRQSRAEPTGAAFFVLLHFPPPVVKPEKMTCYLAVPMTKKTYRLFDHTADLGVEIFGRTREDLFVHAALAIVGLTTDAKRIKPDLEKRFSVEGADQTDLFINYLREVLYLINGEGFLPREVTINEIHTRRLTATLRGEYFNTRKHRINKEIKAVTYHQASVEETEKGWKGRVIFDV
jgi:SHS2 domain-containing protein